MIASLYGFLMKPRLLHLAIRLALCFLLGAAAVYLFVPERVSDLALLRKELPEVMTALGYFGSANLGIHVSGVLLMMLLPMVLAFSSISQAEHHLGLPLADGRLAQLLAAPHRRSTILLTLCLCAVTETLLLWLSALLGQVLLMLILFPGANNLLALLRLNLGLLLVCLPFPGASLLIVLTKEPQRKARRLSRLVFLLSFVGLSASRFPGFARFFRFLSPLSLLKTQEALASFQGLMAPLWGLGILIMLLLITLGIFQQREL